MISTRVAQLSAVGDPILTFCNAPWFAEVLSSAAAFLIWLHAQDLKQDPKAYLLFSHSAEGKHYICSLLNALCTVMDTCGASCSPAGVASTGKTNKPAAISWLSRVTERPKSLATSYITTVKGHQLRGFSLS